MEIKTTKDKLLFILKKHHSITIEKVMEFFTISEPAVRKHLHELERNKFIRKLAHKQEIGRPFYTYELTRKGHGIFPNQYEELPVQLLKDLEELQGLEMVEALLHKRMEREEVHLIKAMDSEDFEAKIQQLVAIQNESGYMFEMEQTKEGDYVLINYHCPIVNIAKNYKQVCANERKMYNHVFHEGKVIPASYITNGSPICKWIIKSPEKR